MKNPKLFLLLVGTEAALSVSLSLFGENDPLFWIGSILTVFFAVVLAYASLDLNRSKAAPSRTASVPAGYVWQSVAVGVLLYALVQIYSGIITFTFTSLAQGFNESSAAAILASVPLVGGMFAFIIGSSYMVALTRPLMGSLIAAFTLTCLAIFIQIGFVAIGHTSHLSHFQNHSIVDIASGFVMSLCAILVCLVSGVLTSWLAKLFLRVVG